MTPRWALLPGRVPPFARMFEEPCTPRVIDVLARAYLVARVLVVTNRVRHLRLVGALLHRRTLREADLAHMLGHRGRARVLGVFVARFIGLS